MQNPFRRLKHYRSNSYDPKENHATETLAACLAFSESFRGEFLNFLYYGTEGEQPKELSDATQIEVVTQLPASEFGTMDLVLRTKDYAVVVEIKVNAAEDERHKQQLDKYDEWLRTNYPKGNALFTLVRCPDPKFKHASVRKKCSWPQLFERVKEFSKKRENSTDRALLEAFCDYLTVEGVVDNMDYTKLIDYGKGWAAERALEGLLTKTQELIKRTTPDLLEPRNYEPPRESPSYQFGREYWKEIFGKEGWNNKVYAWFCTPATEGPSCKECEFRFEIWLWAQGHGHDWNFTANRLPAWMKYFGKKGKRGFYSRRGDWSDWEDGQLPNQVNRYVVCPDAVASNLKVSEDALKNVDNLAQQLAERVETCIRLVDGLRPLG